MNIWWVVLFLYVYMHIYVFDISCQVLDGSRDVLWLRIHDSRTHIKC